MLHTSDWHVGRTFHGQDLLADQEAVLGAIAELVAEHGVQLVLLSGDLYDRAVPSPEAVQVASRALWRIRAAGATIVAIGGNHDSAPRLGAFSDFMAGGGFHLHTSAAQIGPPVMVNDEDGAVAVYPIPYLEPEIACGALDVARPARHQAVLTAALDRVRGDLAARPAGTRSVVLAHAFVVGGVAGGSERSIAVGGVESVTADVFDGIDYVALGHLHGSQVLDDRLRYSGSPLAYSFNEAGHTKGVWLVDLAGDGSVQAERLTLPVPRPLAVVSGDLEEVLAGNDELTGHYLSVELTDPVRPLEPMRRLREKFPFAVTVAWNGPHGAAQPVRFPAAVPGVSDGAVIAAFLADCRGSEATDAEQRLLDQAMADQRMAEARG